MNPDNKDVYENPDINPHKTIVGGRPDNNGTLLKGFPSGIQKLMLSASLNDEIRSEVIGNPGEAAKKYNIELTDSEFAILSSIPEKQIKSMIEGLENNPNIHRRDFLFKSAAAVVAVAASALGVNAQDYPVSKGISPDRPGNEHITTRGIDLDVPPLTWYNSLDQAMKDAQKNKQVVIAVFQRSKEFISKTMPSEAEIHSIRICEMNSAELRRLIFKYRFITVSVTNEKTAKKYKIKDFPTILFLSSTNKELGRIRKPKDDDEIHKAIEDAKLKNDKIT